MAHSNDTMQKKFYRKAEVDKNKKLLKARLEKLKIPFYGDEYSQEEK